MKKKNVRDIHIELKNSTYFSGYSEDLDKEVGKGLGIYQTDNNILIKLNGVLKENYHIFILYPL